jgi:hypothetical protein
MTERSDAQDIQLLYEGNYVSSKPIVEFRARDGFPGHAFVLVGKELDNGLIHYQTIGDFYPEEGNKITTFKNILRGPGEVVYKPSVI